MQGRNKVIEVGLLTLILLLTAAGITFARQSDPGMMGLDSSAVTEAPQAPEGPIHAAVRQFLTDDEWNPIPVEGTNDFQSSYQGDNGTWAVFAVVLEERDEFAFYSALPDTVPPNRRLAVAEFLSRANFGMYIGNFEIDMVDGQVRFKTSIDVEGGNLTQTMLKNLTYLNVLTMDRYYPGIVKVAIEGVDPVVAIGEIEQ